MKPVFIGILLLLLLMFIFQACALFSSNGTEQQACQVISRGKDFEVRYYPEATMATVTASASTYKELGNTGFRKLAGYIFGGNQQNQQIAMTAPVHMEMTDTASSMSFVMPARYSRDQLPAPVNPEVVIKSVPAEYVAVISFGGFASDKKINRYSERLRKALEKQGIQYSGNFRYLGYNPPFQLIGRRNEIMVHITAPSEKMQ
ncbi:MAG: SOUL family heme-binding protein [Bacteroidota bacterium]